MKKVAKIFRIFMFKILFNFATEWLLKLKMGEIKQFKLDSFFISYVFGALPSRYNI